ncbi:hypothetical protein PVAP13_3NG183153 [Panicum virgatum]|uniref:Uncharacterized protein n=1 Tax=Panicum virgatum TaxID=38727 RepID=A0A8T0U9P0_PANVG|nr:hypothetical protein PVAP13_3NG183153 [Panicum virgatum]
MYGIDHLIPASLSSASLIRHEQSISRVLFSLWNPKLAGVADPDLQGAAGWICTAPLPRAAAAVGVEPLPRTKGASAAPAAVSAGHRHEGRQRGPLPSRVQGTYAGRLMSFFFLASCA